MATQGGCMCGNVRYTVEGEPKSKALCHCVDCRKITGSTYSTNGIYAEDDFKVTQGTTKQHVKTADGGNKITSHFCGDCGSTMWREGPSFKGLKVVKVGTLDGGDALDQFQPNTELYSSVRVPWVPAVEGAAQKKGMS
ncbi:Mss4-like protein [Massariosphaeria phaeospora]|uniref:Mss4-like protein n=1 Tax=Massariosphaeria phaeospora TaxID=100035 RepID=A0A7C8IC81_9PLEO|nr:Mss4-like protein [Massariosphaeria phaeospora]